MKCEICKKEVPQTIMVRLAYQVVMQVCSVKCVKKELIKKIEVIEKAEDLFQHGDRVVGERVFDEADELNQLSCNVRNDFDHHISYMIERAESIRDSMNDLMVQLYRDGAGASINDLGVLQSHGFAIDLMAAKFGLFKQLVRHGLPAPKREPVALTPTLKS